MLAAGSAWRILEAEHSRLRQLLAAIASLLDDDAWEQGGPLRDRLLATIRDLQDFETRTHRPKGVILLGVMRGRLAEADRLLDALEDESRRCDELLARALGMLQAQESGGEPPCGARVCEEVGSLLRQYRDLMIRHLDQEDTALRCYTSQLLSSDEWSRVVSSMSREVKKTKNGRARTGD